MNPKIKIRDQNDV